jgi:hypothetical protein
LQLAQWSPKQSNAPQVPLVTHWPLLSQLETVFDSQRFAPGVQTEQRVLRQPSMQLSAAPHWPPLAHTRRWLASVHSAAPVVHSAHWPLPQPSGQATGVSHWPWALHDWRLLVPAMQRDSPAMHSVQWLFVHVSAQASAVPQVPSAVQVRRPLPSHMVCPALHTLHD